MVGLTMSQKAFQEMLHSPRARTPRKWAKTVDASCTLCIALNPPLIRRGPLSSRVRLEQLSPLCSAADLLARFCVLDLDGLDLKHMAAYLHREFNALWRRLETLNLLVWHEQR